MRRKVGVAGTLADGERGGCGGRWPTAETDPRGGRGRDRRGRGGAASGAPVQRTDRRRGHETDRSLASVLLRLFPRPPSPDPAGGRAPGQRAADDVAALV